ncbi:MAG: Uma2 family endonuclease [Chloroflexales bacterium]|nr:Uma2 family endonuclease [Chloroflexales bacterium]
MAVEITRHTFTIHDYARMRESGILTATDRVELIDGEIRNMSPIGPHHAAVVTKIVKFLTRLVDDEIIISPQNPVQLNDYTEPQPDIAVLRYRDDYYAHTHPTAADILIVIEVADTTIIYDREEKVPRYAAAGVPEAWVVDLAQQLIEQYLLPAQGHYTRIQKVLLGDTIASPTAPSISLNTSLILG